MQLTDGDLLDRCLAVGLTLDEVESIYDGTGTSVGKILGRIVVAELAQSDAQSAARSRRNVVLDASPVPAGAAGIASNDCRAEPVGVGTTRWRRENGPSFSLSVRLDHDEVEELRLRAADRNVGVSVMARAYIRSGLSGPRAAPCD